MNLRFDLKQVGPTDIRLAILDDDDVLWPHPLSSADGSAVFDSEDVLSYLADAWASLLLSEIWPDIFEAGQEPRSLTGLLRAAEGRWEEKTVVDEAGLKAEQAEIETFLYRHDLGSMKLGGLVPEFLVLRQGSRYRFETANQVFHTCPYSLFVNELEKLGALARDCLVAAGSAYERTVKRWDERNDAAPTLIASFVTGSRQAELDEEREILRPFLSSLSGRSLRHVANDNAQPMMAVARSSGGLGPRGVADMIQRFRALPPRPTAKLAQRRRVVQADLRDISNPTDQGVRVATNIRDWLRQAADAAVDLQDLCDRLDVAVEQADDLDGRIDGLASAGPDHGPSILLNRNTRRRGATPDDLDRALRFTWAHELGHLLLDDTDWPAITDAAQQRVPRWIETRANAFAAYLLLPPTAAYQALEVHRPRMVWADLEAACNELCQRYGVTRIVVSRQVVRGAPFERRRQLETVFRQNIPNF